MKHAGAETLKTLDPVLRQIRKHAVLVEKTPGAFYLRSKAFHFHEDPAGIFVDLKENLLTFTRYRATTGREQRNLLNRVDRCLKTLSASPKNRRKSEPS
jgi:hypothetical protein